MLRDHFKELEFSKEQWKWLGGKLRIKAGKFDARFELYQNEIANQGRIKKLPFSFLTSDALRMPVIITQEDKLHSDEKEKDICDLFAQYYEDKLNKEEDFEFDFEQADEEWMVRGKQKYEKRTNIEDLLGKVEATKPRMIGLKSFHQMKGKERKFNNEKPSKE